MGCNIEELRSGWLVTQETAPQFYSSNCRDQKGTSSSYCNIESGTRCYFYKVGRRREERYHEFLTY